jgi:DNA-binding NarL/FixJ family response regulator
MRVQIVDDNDDYRKLLRRILEEHQDLVLVAEASGGEEGVRLAQHFKPDVILMDIDMPGTNGFQATRRIKESLAGATVLILSGLDSEAYRERAAECGADAYLLKTTSISEILAALRKVRPIKVT